MHKNHQKKDIFLESLDSTAYNEFGNKSLCMIYNEMLAGWRIGRP
jgi:hypothetical protein